MYQGSALPEGKMQLNERENCKACDEASPFRLQIDLREWNVERLIAFRAQFISI